MRGDFRSERSIALATILLTVTFAGLMTGPTRAGPLDPCADTGLGAATVDNHVCLNSETIKTVHEDLTTANATELSEANTTFVTFTILDHDRWTVMQGGTGADLLLDPAEWTDPLPAGDLDLNTSTDDQVTRVHLRTPMTTTWKDELNNEGVEVLASRPGNWFVANVSNADTNWTDLAFVDGLEPISTGQMLDDRLVNASGPTKVNAVPWRPTQSLFHDACRALASLGGKTNQAVSGPATGIVAGELEAANLTALAANPAIAWVQPALNGTNETMDNIRSVTGAKDLHKAPDWSDHTGEGVTGMTVAADGVYKHHEELNSSIVHYHDRGRDYAQGCPHDPSSYVEGTVDDTSLDHGTSTFGIIYADGDSNDGEKPISTEREKKLIGMAPNASGVVMEHKRLQRLQQVQAESEHGISFASYSWKYVPNNVKDHAQRPAYTLPSMENDLVVAEAGISVYQSMGNAGPGQAAPAAVAKNAISVGGLYHDDDRNLSNDGWAKQGDEHDRASTGPTMDGRIKPDLVGPYDAVFTTTYVEVMAPNGTTDFKQTSAATPVVAGAGALAEQLYDDGAFLNANEQPTYGTPKPSLVKALLVNSAHTFDLTVDPAKVGPDAQKSENKTEYVDPSNTRHFQGWGQPNVTVLDDPDNEIFTVNETVDLVTGARYTVEYDLPPHAAWLRVTLSWTDPPTPPGQAFQEGEPGARGNTSALVNDLDLEVIAPDDTTYLGNGGMMMDNESEPVGTGLVGYPVTGADRLNNVESVFVNVSDTDTWTTMVKATGVDIDARPSTPAIDQPFGLVIRPIGEPADDGGGGEAAGCCTHDMYHPMWP